LFAFRALGNCNGRIDDALNTWCKVDVFQLVTEDLVQSISLDPQLNGLHIDMMWITHIQLWMSISLDPQFK
jgi:hypothetical protein